LSSAAEAKAERRPSRRYRRHNGGGGDDRPRHFTNRNGPATSAVASANRDGCDRRANVRSGAGPISLESAA
jgi:hypothetical protein